MLTEPGKYINRENMTPEDFKKEAIALIDELAWQCSELAEKYEAHPEVEGLNSFETSELYTRVMKFFETHDPQPLSYRVLPGEVSQDAIDKLAKLFIQEVNKTKND